MAERDESDFSEEKSRIKILSLSLKKFIDSIQETGQAKAVALLSVKQDKCHRLEAVIFSEMDFTKRTTRAMIKQVSLAHQIFTESLRGLSIPTILSYQPLKGENIEKLLDDFKQKRSKDKSIEHISIRNF